MLWGGFIIFILKLSEHYIFMESLLYLSSLNLELQPKLMQLLIHTIDSQRNGHILISRN
jgi:hypothetical protein